MRCSLLTLSSYLDRELPPDRAAEVDAHLIGCTRCQTGLGYLREESQRVRTLSHVTVSEESAHAILAAVGLLNEDEPLPGERRFQQPAPPEHGVPPWAQGRGETGRALPWSPRAPVRPQVPSPPPAHAIPAPPPLPEQSPQLLDDPYTLTMAFDGAAPSTVDPDTEPSLPLDSAGVIETGLVAQPDEEIEVAGTAYELDERWELDDLDDVVETPVVIDDEPHELPDAIQTQEPEAVVAPVAPIEPEVWVQEPQPPPLPPQHSFTDATIFGPPSTPKPPGPLTRLRDALMVRMALLRGEPKLDPDVQIVSGAGAPARGVYPAGPLSDLPHHPAHLEAALHVDDAVHMDDLVDTPTSTEPAEDARFIPDAASLHDAAPMRDAAPWTDIEPPAETQSAPRPGRHMRALQHSLGSRPSWMSLEPLRQLNRSIAASRSPAVGVAGRDSRLWIFGAAVLVLLVVGVLIGKQTTPLPLTGTGTAITPAAPRTNPVQSTPGVQPSAVASPAAQTAAPTAAPVVTALPPLTSAKTIGSGATQYSVQDLRYGAHPGDYRMVFDLNDTTGAGGTPKVTLGFADNGADLYVELFAVPATGTPPQPAAGGTVTGVQLEPNPPAGTVVYRFTLSKKSTLSAYFLINSTRLVIDLT